MTSGVSLDSYTKLATWTAVAGTWDTGYPVTNLGDLVRPSNVARVTPAGGGLIGMSAVLPAAVPIRMIAIVNHTCSAFASLLVRIWSDAGTTTLTYDNGGQTLYPTGLPDDTYSKVRPLILPSEVQGRHIEIQIGGLTGPTEFGAVEISRFWDWGGASNGAQVGFDARAPAMGFAGGASQGVDQFMPRIYNGQIDYVALAQAATNGIDFQKIKGTSYPLVVVDNYEDATAWPLGCFLARNSDIPPMVGAMYRHDTFQFRLTEHVR